MFKAHKHDNRGTLICVSMTAWLRRRNLSVRKRVIPSFWLKSRPSGLFSNYTWALILGDVWDMFTASTLTPARDCKSHIMGSEGVKWGNTNSVGIQCYLPLYYSRKPLRINKNKRRMEMGFRVSAIPLGKEVIPSPVERMVRFLYWLRWCVLSKAY